MLLPIIQIVVSALAPHLPTIVLAVAVADALICADQGSLHGVLTCLGGLGREAMRHHLIKLLHPIKLLARRKHNLTRLQRLIRLTLLLALTASIHRKNGTNKLPTVHYRHFLALNILEYSGIRLLLIHSLLLATNSLQHFILRIVVHHAQMVLLGRLYEGQVNLLGLLRLLVVLS